MRPFDFRAGAAGKRLLRALVVASAVLGAGGGCSYDPKFADGTLKCSVNAECPDGYSCRGAACYSDKNAATTPAEVSKYIGTWTLGITSTVTTICPGGAPSVSQLSPAGSPSLMTIAAGPMGGNQLRSTWLCILDLNVDSRGAHLSDGAPSCSDMGTAPITLQTWTATEFEILGNTGATAMHTAKYTRRDDYADGTTQRCMQTVTAPLTKNVP